MHFTLQRMMRARRKPKAPSMSLQKLLEIEKNPSIPVFQKALAAIRAHHSLDPKLDDLFWRSLTNFEKIDPVPTPELAPFLRKLTSIKMNRKQIALIGDIAYKSNILDDLPNKFTLEYLKSLGHNPFRAIELAKRYQLPYYIQVKLYLKADQFKAAESLASNNRLDDGIIVDFIIAYARIQDQESVDRWISQLIAPSPDHLSKIRHFLLLYNMQARGHHFQVEKRPKLESGKDIRLVTAVNKLVSRYPDILEGELYQKWAQLLLGNLDILSQLLDEIAESALLAQGDLEEILRFAPLKLTLEIMEKMNYSSRYPRPLSSDWCTALNKLNDGYNTSLMVEQIKYSQCLDNTNVVSALCRFKPQGLVDIVLSMKSSPNEYQILSCWKAYPSKAQAAKLEEWPVTPSFALLRAVISAYHEHNDFVAIARWLRKYQIEHGLELSEKFLVEIEKTLVGAKVSPQKLSAPMPGPQDWKFTIKRVLPPWISSEWVLAHL